MEQYFCFFVILAIITLSVFFYLRNTARKKVTQKKTVAGTEEFLPVYVSLADKPDSIIQGLNRFVSQVQDTESAGDKWRWIPLTLFFGGLALMGIDLVLILLGFQSSVFTMGGILIWVAAIFMARGLRKSDSMNFSPSYYGTKTIIHTLRDDLKPGSTLTGHLDLTGALLKTKIARSTKDSRDRTTNLFRDEWLSLKAKLYDGNILRVSAVQKSKKRDSYWKRGISGKMKMKPEKFKGSEQFLKVRLAANPDVYKIKNSTKFKQGMNIGKYTIAQLVSEGGIIDVTATSPFDNVEPEQILNVLKSMYTLLQRKSS